MKFIEKKIRKISLIACFAVASSVFAASCDPFKDLEGCRDILKILYYCSLTRSLYTDPLNDIKNANLIYFARIFQGKIYANISYGPIEKFSPEQEILVRNKLKAIGLKNADSIELGVIKRGQGFTAMAVNSNLMLFDQLDINTLQLSDKGFEFLVGHEGGHALSKDTEKAALLTLISLVGPLAGTMSLCSLGDYVFKELSNESDDKKKTPILWEIAKLYLTFKAPAFLTEVLYSFVPPFLQSSEFKADKTAVKAFGSEGCREFLNKIICMYGDNGDIVHPKPSQRLAVVATPPAA